MGTAMDQGAIRQMKALTAEMNHIIDSHEEYDANFIRNLVDHLRGIVRSNGEIGEMAMGLICAEVLTEMASQDMDESGGIENTYRAGAAAELRALRTEIDAMADTDQDRILEVTAELREIILSNGMEGFAAFFLFGSEMHVPGAVG